LYIDFGLNCHSRLRFADGFGKASESGNPDLSHSGFQLKAGMTKIK